MGEEVLESSELREREREGEEEEEGGELIVAKSKSFFFIGDPASKRQGDVFLVL